MVHMVRLPMHDAHSGELGIVQSMNRPGKIPDNAFIESFFHSLTAERSVLKHYLPFYNRARLHSSLGYVSPATFERQAQGTGCQ